MIEYKEKVESILQKKQHYGDYHRRDKLVQKYAWAIPNETALTTLVDYGPLIEIGAGNGYWASLIEQTGGTVYPYDKEPPDETYTTVQKGTTDVLTEQNANTLFLCWPPFGSPMASKCLEKFGGDYVAYIGEWRGKTATNEFHTQLREMGEFETMVQLPQWENISDKLFVFKLN